MANPSPIPSPETQFPEQNGFEPGIDNLSPIAQVKRMQRALYVASSKEGIDNRELAALACAWDRLEERKRVMTMRPAPKPIDVSDRTKIKRQRSHASPVMIDPSSPGPGPSKTA